MKISTGRIKFGDGKASKKHIEKIMLEAIKQEYAYAKLGLILGLAAIIGGIVLCIHGAAGSSSWTTEILQLSSEINDATPGALLFVVGIFYVFLTRPKLNLGDIE